MDAERGQELGPVVQSITAPFRMVISLHGLNLRSIEVLQATYTCRIHRRWLLCSKGQEVSTQEESSLRHVACEWLPVLVVVSVLTFLLLSQVG